MKNLLKNITIVCCLLMTTTSKAEDCQEVIQACSQALIEQDKLIELLEAEKKIIFEENKVLVNSNESLRKDNNKWYKDPLTMTLLGVIIGVGISR
jgi:hypothetical protein